MQQNGSAVIGNPAWYFVSSLARVLLLPMALLLIGVAIYFASASVCQFIDRQLTARRLRELNQIRAENRRESETERAIKSAEEELIEQIESVRKAEESRRIENLRIERLERERMRKQERSSEEAIADVLNEF